jgi:hypothetical protein
VSSMIRKRHERGGWIVRVTADGLKSDAVFAAYCVSLMVAGAVFLSLLVKWVQS